jgi:cobalamin biosynthesis protein CobW
VVAVVDGPAVAAGLFADDPVAVQAQREADEMLDHDSPLAEVFEDQLACADIVVLGKTDLMDAAALASTTETVLAEAQPGVRVIAARHGAVDPALLLGLGAAVEDAVDARLTHHDDEEDHDHDEFDSIVVDIPAVDAPDTIAARARDALAAEGVLRIKGVAAVDGKDARLVVQGVGARLDHYYDRPWRAGEGRTGKLVVIGLAGFDRDAAIAMLRG